MNIDTGLAVVIVAVLVFYLRLIILQRQSAKRLAQAPPPVKKQSRKKAAPPPDFMRRYSILSTKRLDLAIAGAGILAIAAGILLNLRVLNLPAVEPYWWLPTAAGIIAFSWAFKF